MIETTNDAGRREVVVVDVAIPFISMVVLLVKWALAAIPAIIILVVLSGVLTAFWSGVIRGLT